MPASQSLAPWGRQKLELGGQRFGHWTVTDDWERRKRSTTNTAKGWTTRIYWRCICDCGFEKWVDAGSLRDGKSRGCGCQAGLGHRHVAPGRNFGLWTVVELGEPQIVAYGKTRRWLCRCACGKERHIQPTELRKGKTRSCVQCANKANRTR